MGMKFEWLVETYNGLETIKSERLPEAIDIKKYLREEICNHLAPLDIENAAIAEAKGNPSVMTVRHPGPDDLAYAVGEDPHITARLVEA